MINLGYGRPERPGESRGILPLLVAALASGAIRAGVGAITANQTKQRNKGYINQSYRTASQRMNVDQNSARQGIAESLNARGLAQGGEVTASPIHAAMQGETMQSTGPAPTTVGGAVVNDANVEMGLEKQDLEQQHDRALTENKADYNNALLGAGAAGVQTGISVYGAGKDLQASRGAGAAASRSKIHAAMLSGSSYEGVHPNDPLGEPTSAWSTHPRSLLGEPGQSNASFNVG